MCFKAPNWMPPMTQNFFLAKYLLLLFPRSWKTDFLLSKDFFTQNILMFSNYVIFTVTHFESAFHMMFTQWKLKIHVLFFGGAKATPTKMSFKKNPELFSYRTKFSYFPMNILLIISLRKQSCKKKSAPI